MCALGVTLRGLAPGEYSQRTPFDHVQANLRSWRAALVVGLERSCAYAVFERERSEREKGFSKQRPSEQAGHARSSGPAAAARMEYSRGRSRADSIRY